jgi:MoaA/NifB/PqqE/SkfB family radical SAM enzyme
MDTYRYDFLLHTTVHSSEDWGFRPPELAGLPTEIDAQREELARITKDELWRRSRDNLIYYKAVNYALAIEEWRDGVEEALALPFSVMINHDNHCNLRCVYCRPIGITLPRMRTMHSEMWAPATEVLLPAAVEFLPFCWGEPLLPSSRFSEVCTASEKFGVQMGIITHMNTLDDEHANLFVKHVGRALISIDTANPERYAQLRDGGKLERVERNISTLQQRARRMGVPMPYLGVSSVIMAQNLEELPSVVEWAANNGVRGVYAGRLVATEGISEWARGELVDLTSPTYLDVFRECRTRAKTLGVELSIHNPEDPIGADRMCPCPWQHVYVCSDGGVSFCNFSREIVLDRLPVTQKFWAQGLAAERRKAWNHEFRCDGCQSTDYDGRPGVSQFRGQ